MPDDYRVRTTFSTNRKRRRLHRRLGPEGVLALIDLWAYCARERPDGVLTGLTAEDLADEAYWAGNPDEFIEALLSTGFLEPAEGGGWQLHDWAEHQPWVASRPARVNAARKAIHERWASRGACKGGTPWCDDRCKKKPSNKAPLYGAYTGVIRNVQTRNTPSPFPSPINPPPNPPAVAPAASSSSGPGGGGGVSVAAGSDPSPPPGQAPPPSSPPEPRPGVDPGAGQGVPPKKPPGPEQGLGGGNVQLGQRLDSLADPDPVPGHLLEAEVCRAQIDAPVGQGARGLRRTMALAPITAGELRYALAEAKGAVITQSLDGYLARVIAGHRANGGRPPGRKSNVAPGSIATSPPTHVPEMIRAQHERGAATWRDLFARHGYPPHESRATTWADRQPDPELVALLAESRGCWQTFDAAMEQARLEGQRQLAALFGGAVAGG